MCVCRCVCVCVCVSVGDGWWVCDVSVCVCVCVCVSVCESMGVCESVCGNGYLSVWVRCRWGCVCSVRGRVSGVLVWLCHCVMCVSLSVSVTVCVCLMTTQGHYDQCLGTTKSKHGEEVEHHEGFSFNWIKTHTDTQTGKQIETETQRETQTHTQTQAHKLTTTERHKHTTQEDINTYSKEANQDRGGFKRTKECGIIRHSTMALGFERTGVWGPPPKHENLVPLAPKIAVPRKQLIGAGPQTY